MKVVCLLPSCTSITMCQLANLATKVRPTQLIIYTFFFLFCSDYFSSSSFLSDLLSSLSLPPSLLPWLRASYFFPGELKSAQSLLPGVADILGRYVIKVRKGRNWAPSSVSIFKQDWPFHTILCLLVLKTQAFRTLCGRCTKNVKDKSKTIIVPHVSISTGNKNEWNPLRFSIW